MKKLFTLSLLIVSGALFAQGPLPALPNFSYVTPQTYTAGTAVTALLPTNSGGAVPAGGSTNATGPAASFNNPTGIAVDASGNVYVAETPNHVIRKISSAGVVSIFAGSEIGDAGSTNGLGTAASFSSPYGLAVDAAGNVYVADLGNNKIRKITPEGLVSDFAGSGAEGSTNGTSIAASFKGIIAVAADASGNVYVSDSGNHLIRKITSGGVVTTLANLVADTSDPSSSNISGIAVDASGNVYAAEFNSNIIRKITPGGVVTTFAGSGTNGSANGTGIAASFQGPLGLGVDAFGNVFAADLGNNKIRKITPTGVVSDFAGSGTGSVASLWSPTGVAVDASGKVCVADYATSNITLKIIPFGYSISPALPAGLTFDPTTGAISGTPTAASAATDYTITATNETGSSSTVVRISVGVVNETSQTEIKPAFWNTTLASLDTQILANYVPGYQMYRFEVSNGTTTNTYEVAKYNFDLTKVPGTAYATTYSIRVALKIGGTWGSYGNAHNVTTPALASNTVLSTKLLSNFCGATLAALDTKIGTMPVYAAIGSTGNYRFEITTAGVTTLYDSPTYNFRLAQAGVAAYGTTYTIRVAAQVNGIYGNYGSACTVTTPILVTNTVPTTTIQPNFCGATLATLDTKIGAVLVAGATKGRFEVTIAGGSPVVYEVAAYNFKLSQTGVAVLYNTSYSIRVAALVGGVWGNYGASCTVTTPSAPKARLKAKSFEVAAYPNPFETAFNLNLETPSKEEVTIAVYDMMGKLVETHRINPIDIADLQIGSNFAAGIYNVIVSQANEMKAIRLIRK
jgi:sugar lactone lactonase YvrE